MGNEAAARQAEALRASIAAAKDLGRAPERRQTAARLAMSCLACEVPPLDPLPLRPFAWKFLEGVLFARMAATADGPEWTVADIRDLLAAPAFEVDEFVTAAKQRYPETRRYFDGLASVSQSMRWGIYQYAGRAIAALNDGGQL